MFTIEVNPDCFWPSADGYLAETIAQQEFKDLGLKVKAGAEIGFQRKYENVIEKIVNQYPFDYVLGAIHCLQGCSIASKYESIDYFAHRDLATVGHEYFTLLEEAVKSGFFDAIAHLDIYCRYGKETFWRPNFHSSPGNSRTDSERNGQTKHGLGDKYFKLEQRAERISSL